MEKCLRNTTGYLHRKIDTKNLEELKDVHK
jgi:hypothetical protein